jgi:chromate transporter
MSAPDLATLTRTFARIGILSFGGPAAQIALMHREVVDRHRWVEERDYLSALSFCMLLPGPEAMQLATWIGWRTHGTAGGLIAGGLFVLPGALVVLALSAVYAAFGTLPVIAAVFGGVQAAVIAVVIEALLRLSKRALRGRADLAVAALSFAALYVFGLPFPLVILAAALWGLVTARGAVGPTPAGPAPWGATLRAVLVWGAVWLVPLGLLGLQGGLLAEIGLFFSKLALLTFGGAYAVLAWMAQEVVDSRHWLSLKQMIDGLALAETTPGPLILVTEFVAFVTGHARGGWGQALAAAGVALWMTFAPCFLWIFAGAPWIARLTAVPRLRGALAAITAAVVGVIASLSLWFALHVLFGATFRPDWGPLSPLLPEIGSLRPLPLVIAVLAGVALIGRRWPLPLVLLLAALPGAAGLGW